MPIFGEYETLDTPLLINERHGQSRVLWIAHRRGQGNGRVYFIKAVPRPGPGSAFQKDDCRHSRADVTADFLESIARLKEAYRFHPEGIAPIRASGQTDTELWYATDYYPRQSLAEFYSTAADINDESLRHLVYSVASACLALQRSTGLSHGNLKTSNLLLKGSGGPLRSTQLRLTDAAGPSSLQASLGVSQGPLGGNLGAALRDTTEARDLRGIGAIILELVESNPIEGPEDYTLPIEMSGPWRALGEASRRWLDLCNQLLNPDLSLHEINLHSLANEFAPRPKRNHAKAWVAGLSVVFVGVIASYPLWIRPVTQLTKMGGHAPQRVASTLRPTPIVPDRTIPERVHSTVGNTNAVVAALPPRSQTTEPAPLAVPAPVSTNDSSAAEAAAIQSASGAPAVSSTGRSDDVDAAELSSKVPEPSPATPPETGANSNPVAPVMLPPPFAGAPSGLQPQSTEPAREMASADPKPINSNPPLSHSNAPTSGFLPRETRSLGQSVVSRPRPIDVAELDAQLDRLEGEVARVVAVRRNSVLFPTVDLLEAKYAKARHLSVTTKKRLDLLRATMMKKIPGAKTQHNMNGVAAE